MKEATVVLALTAEARSQGFFLDVGPVRRVGGANRDSFSGTWWVVVLTTWVGGGAGLDADLAAEATLVERGIQLSTHSGGVLEGK